MSLLDDFCVDDYDLINYSERIDEDLDAIDIMINDIEKTDQIFFYNKLISNYNIIFFLIYFFLRDNMNKQLVIYNKYGFDCGYNMYYLYLIIIELNVKFIVNFANYQ